MWDWMIDRRRVGFAGMANDGEVGMTLPLLPTRPRSTFGAYSRPLREGRPFLYLESFSGPAAHAPRDRFLAGRQYFAELPADRRVLRAPHPRNPGDRRRHRADQADRARSAACA